MAESRALDINSRGQVELWPLILERAFIVHRFRMKTGGSSPGQEFQGVGHGDAQSAYYVLTGQLVREWMRPQFPSRHAQLRAIERHLESARPVMLSTGKWTQAEERPFWWREDHVYVVVAVQANRLTVLDPGSGQMVARIKIGDWIDSTEVKRFLFCE
jgi:hypothetical protein